MPRHATLLPRHAAPCRERKASRCHQHSFLARSASIDVIYIRHLYTSLTPALLPRQERIVADLRAKWERSGVQVFGCGSARDAAEARLRAQVSRVPASRCVMPRPV